MVYSYRPNDKVLAMIEQLGGSIWTEVTDMAAGGVAVARAVVENHLVPDKAKMLLGWRPIDIPAVEAVAESSLSVFDISGPNYNFQPQEVFCGCVADSVLGATGGMFHSESEYYDVFAPVAGGETIAIGVEPLDAIAGNRRCGVEFTWTDVRPPLPVIRSLCSRETAVAAAAGINAGPALAITDAHELIEVGGAATHAAITAAEELNITLILKCTAWPVNEIRILFEPTGSVEVATPGGFNAYLTRRLERMKFSQPTATINADYDVDIALTAAGQAGHFIRWI
jgi:hypothetical protein